MAIAHKCDRCGKYYEIYNTDNDDTKINALIFLNRDDNHKYWSHDPVEFCPECSNEFMSWWNGGKVE